MSALLMHPAAAKVTLVGDAASVARCFVKSNCFGANYSIAELYGSFDEDFDPSAYGYGDDFDPSAYGYSDDFDPSAYGYGDDFDPYDGYVYDDDFRRRQSSVDDEVQLYMYNDYMYNDDMFDGDGDVVLSHECKFTANETGTLLVKTFKVWPENFCSVDSLQVGDSTKYCGTEGPDDVVLEAGEVSGWMQQRWKFLLIHLLQRSNCKIPPPRP